MKVITAMLKVPYLLLSPINFKRKNSPFITTMLEAPYLLLGATKFKKKNSSVIKNNYSSVRRTLSPTRGY